MARIGFCGLGVMGSPMAGHLATAGHEVFVYNRTRSKAEEWSAQYAGIVCETPADVARQCDIVMVCVGNDNDVRDVILGVNGVLSGSRPGMIVVDQSTTTAVLARELADTLGAHDISFIDAPVSGGQDGAQNGVLTVMCGANDANAFSQFAEVAQAYARSCERMGPNGNGQLTKMVNQICISGLVQALAEGVAFAQNAGLDVDKVIDVISKGAAQSWQMENRGRTMAQDSFNFGFAVEWMIKDVEYCLQEAERNGSQLPITDIVLNYWRENVRHGDARMDTSVLIRRLNGAYDK
jgi:3-hydroxyisobutyrate dehydrogenase-like beta-hydroxyacid dehydrogenase